jgi:hypothetical protein
MQTGDGKLFHRYAKGEKAIFGFLDDYASLVFGLIELYEACFDEKYLHASVALTNKMIAEFWDTEKGGFYLTIKGDDNAVPRIKQTYDGAIPSGNSIALYDLLRLARLSSEVSFDEYANKMLQTVSVDVKGYPMGHTFMLSCLNFAIGPSFNVVLAGDLIAEDTQVMLAALRKNYVPHLTIKVLTPDKKNPPAKSSMNYIKIDGKATAYVCRDQTCMPPTNEVMKMLEYLKI